jgi:hypothetical protein
MAAASATVGGCVLNSVRYYDENAEAFFTDTVGADMRALHARFLRRPFKPALAVAARSPSPADILDPLIFKITDDRILAAFVRAAHDLGSTALATFDAYVAALCASRTTIRAAYGLTVSALRERIDEGPRQGFLKAVPDDGRKIALAHRRAHHWAHRRLTSGDAGAEHLALISMSAPFPGSFDQLALPADAGPLEELFRRRLVKKADGWGHDTLFGQPSPPKWLFAQMQDL